MEMKDRIKFLREKNGLTLEDVGKVVGVGKSTVRKWETGDIANMRRDKIAKLAEALHTTPGYLMGWELAPDAGPVYEDMMFQLAEDRDSGREEARDKMLQTHGTNYDTHILRLVNGKTVLMYYHAFDDTRNGSAGSSLLGYVERLQPTEAAHLELLIEAYYAADARARQMVDLALEPFVSAERKEYGYTLQSDRPAFIDPDDLELAHQINEDKKSGGRSSVSNGAAGKKKEA